MNIDDMTIGQAREVMALIGGSRGATPDAPNPMIGKYCVFRGYNHGVYCGKFAAVVMMGNVAFAEVHDARRMQYQEYNGYTLSSVASEGIAAGSKLSAPVPVHMLRLLDDSEIFALSESAERLCREIPNGVA